MLAIYKMSITVDCGTSAATVHRSTKSTRHRAITSYHARQPSAPKIYRRELWNSAKPSTTTTTSFCRWWNSSGDSFPMIRCQKCTWTIMQRKMGSRDPSITRAAKIAYTTVSSSLWARNTRRWCGIVKRKLPNRMPLWCVCTGWASTRSIIWLQSGV